MKKSKLVFIAGLGTLFETFDFYLFSLFLVAFNYSLFGSIDKRPVLWTVLIFAVGYLARIIGALIFGYWGDKVGRLYSFRKTILIMAVSSIIIGLSPTYKSVGILALIFLIVMRFIQGISYGGEMSGAIIIITERCNKNRPIYIMCIALMSMIGVLLAQSTYWALSNIMSYDNLLDYGWRIAYLFGGIMLFYSYFLRRYISGSDDLKLSIRTRTHSNPILNMLKNHKGVLVLGVFSVVGLQLFWGAYMVYFPSFITLKFTNINIFNHLYYISLIGLIIGRVIGGVIANYTSIRSVYSLATAGSLLIIMPIYYSIIGLTAGHLFAFYILLLIFSIAQGVSGVLYLLMWSIRFPVECRYTLVSTVYAISAFMFIALPPFVFSCFTRENSMYYSMLILVIGYIVQLVSVQFFYKKTEIFV